MYNTNCMFVQRKVSKRNDTRIPPFPCASRFWRGFSEGLSLALRKRAASLPLPYRAILAKNCDARDGITGIKPSHHSAEIQLD
jgi:hypothetical protein